MRVQNIKVKITIPIPIDRPDKNGVVFTRSAIENAINKFPTHSPIIFKDNDKCIDSICVGSTLGSPGAEWDDETQTCKMTINGLIFYSGAEIIANEIKDGKITDFNFMSIGLTT